jgi:hypothetical protein
MGMATRFREIVIARGGKPGTPSTRLLAWLRANGLCERAVAMVGAYVLKKSAYVGPIDFYSEKGILGVNGEDAIPIAMRDGLLIVGGCPNGDPVAVDVREQVGAAGYIGHETMWQEASVRVVFLPLAPSLGELAERLAAGDAPCDYYEALKEHKGRIER